MSKKTNNTPHELNELINDLERAYLARVSCLFELWTEADLHQMNEKELSVALIEVEKVLIKVLEMEKKLGAREKFEEQQDDMDIEDVTQTILERLSRDAAS